MVSVLVTPAIRSRILGRCSLTIICFPSLPSCVCRELVSMYISLLFPFSHLLCQLSCTFIFRFFFFFLILSWDPFCWFFSTPFFVYLLFPLPTDLWFHILFYEYVPNHPRFAFLFARSLFLFFLVLWMCLFWLVLYSSIYQELCDGGRDPALHVLPLMATHSGGIHIRAGHRLHLQTVRQLHPTAVQAFSGTRLHRTVDNRGWMVPREEGMLPAASQSCESS